MEEVWKEYKLGDVLCHKGYIRGPFGSALKRGDLLKEGIPVYEQQHAIYNRREFRYYISEEKYNDMKRFSVCPEDIIISCSGTVGEVSLIKKEDPLGIISQALLLLRVDTKKILPEYLLYFFKTAKGHNSIISRSSGSVQVNIARREVIESIPLLLPCICIQKSIVTVLRTIDDKIECNRRINDNFAISFLLLTCFVLCLLKRINDNFEQQAQTLFDKMFPQISKGDSTVGDMIIPHRGKGLLSKYAVSGDVPVVAGGIEPATYHNVANTMPPVLTIAASGANAGYINLWHIPVWSSDSSFIDSKMTPNVYFWYVMLKKRQKEIFDAQVGSAQPHIYPKHIAELPMQEVEEDRLFDYSKMVAPFFKQIGKNTAENDRLASIRDALLPKLMSGELKLSELTV